MAYLPGMPADPVSTTIKSPAAASLGAPKGIGAIAASVGKPGRTQHLGTVVGRRSAGITSVGGGDPTLHSMGHYGKTPPPMLGGTPTGGVSPTSHPGAQMIRGGSGQMKSHVRRGGLGPGPMSTPGSSDNYSMNNPDME